MGGSRSARLLLAALVLGCAPPDSAGADDRPPIRALNRAVDLDPTPGVVEVSLVAAAGIAEFGGGVATSVLGYRDGGNPMSSVTVPGPLIEATVGDRLRVHFENALPALSTTVHWHGLRLPVEMDGNPMVSGAVEPGEKFEYDFVLRDAGLFWYHPHIDTDVQLESGLQGVLLVHEAEPPLVGRERIFVLDDVGLAEDGSIELELDSKSAMFGRRGDRVTVNGGPPGTAEASAGGVERWRFVNTANGRYFNLFAAGLPLRVIGWDGGLVDVPYVVDTLLLAPGERYDVLVELPRDQERVVLETLSVQRGAIDEDVAAVLVELVVGGASEVEATPEVSGDVAAVATGSEAPLSFVLTSKLDGPTAPVFFINDQRWPLNTPVEVTSGDADTWEVINDGDHSHPFHVHGLFFQVIDVDGAVPPALGWKDTLDIPPGATARLAVPYDEPGMWMFHCQIPEHAERGMMGDLLVQPP